MKPPVRITPQSVNHEGENDDDGCFHRKPHSRVTYYVLCARRNPPTIAPYVTRPNNSPKTVCLPQYRNAGVPPGLPTATQSVPVPVAGESETVLLIFAAKSARVFASVTIPTASMSAASVSGWFTSVIILIVPGFSSYVAASPTASALLTPTVAKHSSSNASRRITRRTSRSITTPVMRPTVGSATPSRRASANKNGPGSSEGYSSVR